MFFAVSCEIKFGKTLFISNPAGKKLIIRVTEADNLLLNDPNNAKFVISLKSKFG